MNKKRFFPYFALFCIGIVPLLVLFHSGLPVTHDGKDHVARIANFYLSLQEGVLIPRWASNLNWGYGHPILMFLYPFPSYASSLFHAVGFSLIDSVKVVFGLSFLLSASAMYLWVAKAYNRYAGFAAAILYMFAPYRFVDLYVRGALGEHVAFVFLPLIMYFLLKLSQKKDMVMICLGALSLAGLLLSHNAISIMFIPIFILYGLYLFLHTEKKKTFLISALTFIVLGFFLAAFFWIPALIEGKYTLRNIVTDTDYGKRFVPFMDFVYGTWSFGGTDMLSKQVGIVQWIMIFLTIGVSWNWYKRKNKTWQVGFGSIIVFLLTLFIMSEQSKIIWDTIKILQNFQFPWRFLAITVFITAFCAGLVVYALPKKRALYAVILISVAAVLLSVSYWRVNGYLLLPDTFFQNIYEGTTDTGESAPIWSVRFMEKKPKSHIKVIEGSASIHEKKRSTVQHAYAIQAEEKVRIRENTLYFPGWEVFVDNAQIQPEFQDPKHRGLLTFYIEKGAHEVVVRFTDTKVRYVSNSITLLALVIIGFFCIMRIGTIWKHSR